MWNLMLNANSFNIFLQKSPKKQLKNSSKAKFRGIVGFGGIFVFLRGYF
jgi:hypothetical protein